MIRNKKILITGGTGFIGSHLAELLAAAKNRVVVVGRQAPHARRAAAPRPGISFLKADISKSAFRTAIQRGGFDYIFHLAGNADQYGSVLDPRSDMEVNFLATFNMLDCLRTMKRRPKFIFASTVTIYGDAQDAQLNEARTVPLPFAPYGASNLAAERYVYVFARQYGIPALTLRLFSTYGPRIRRQMVLDFIRKLSTDPKHIQIMGDGTEARDMTFVADQVINIARVAARGAYRGEVYNLGSGKLYTTTQVANAVASAMKLRPTFSYTGKTRSSDAPRWRADVKKMRTLGCTTPTTLAAGVAQMVSWYQNEKQL